MTSTTPEPGPGPGPGPGSESESESESESGERPARRTFVLVDGENIDATLGNSLLGRRPQPDERPRWERVTDFAAALYGQPVTGLFFLNASKGELPLSFVQALQAMDYRPVPLSGSANQKVVDIGIQRTLEALLNHDADVLLCSHDGDFAPQMRSLVDTGRRVGLIGFKELASAQLRDVLGVTVHDLEDDVRAFTKPLPRLRIIALEDFDPETFLS